MRKLYLIGAIVVFLMVLTLSLPQIGATCSWILIRPSTNAAFVVMQGAALGAIMGGLLILWWKEPAKSSEDDEDLDEK